MWTYALLVSAALATEPIDAVAWLAGSWQSADGRQEELWMPPRGGVMLGLGRITGADGNLRSFEYLRIEVEGDALSYVASPSGQGEARFAAVRISQDEVVFENPVHDFPQRIAYRREGKALSARVETLDGTKGFTFAWTLVEVPR